MSPIKETRYVCQDATKVAKIFLEAAQRAQAKGNEPQAQILARMAQDHIEWDQAFHSPETKQPPTNH